MQGQASLVTMDIGLSLAGKAVSTVGTADKKVISANMQSYCLLYGFRTWCGFAI